MDPSLGRNAIDGSTKPENPITSVYQVPQQWFT
jgi:hypothetical protein